MGAQQSTKSKPLDALLLDIQKRAQQQYPNLSTDKLQACTLTDNTLVDNPIIWVNDDFERMTLYPKEEIIGKNCRFLQGKGTNQDTIEQVRQAIRTGTQCEVLILNYRKNGVAFWNKFNILPICASDKILFGKKQVTHFLSIQEDVTYLEEVGSKPKEWSKYSVGMWLDNIDLGDFSKCFIDSNIDGLELFELDPERLVSEFKLNDSQVEYLLSKIEQIKRNPACAFEAEQSPTGSLGSSSDYSHRSTELSDSNPVSPQEEEMYGNTRRKKNKKFLKRRVAVKCYIGDDIEILLLRPRSTYEKYQFVLKRALYYPVGKEPIAYSLSECDTGKVIRPSDFTPMLRAAYKAEEVVKICAIPVFKEHLPETSLFSSVCPNPAVDAKSSSPKTASPLHSPSLSSREVSGGSPTFLRVIPLEVKPLPLPETKHTKRKSSAAKKSAKDKTMVIYF